MPGDPLAGETLSARNLKLRHLARDLEAIAPGILIAAHGGKVEPLVRLYEIEFHIPAYAIHKAELEESIRR